jgi:hypothetical protein
VWHTLTRSAGVLYVSEFVIAESTTALLHLQHLPIFELSWQSTASLALHYHHSYQHAHSMIMVQPSKHKTNIVLVLACLEVILASYI